MRKIEEQMIDAIKNSQDGNLLTLLFTLTKKTTSLLFDFMDKIAEVGDDYLTLFDGDHQTKLPSHD